MWVWVAYVDAIIVDQTNSINGWMNKWKETPENDKVFI